MIDKIPGDFLQWLRGFYFVAEAGSVRQAAIAMGRTPPTISRQIQCLEKELGITLFDRSHRKMMITPKGKILQKEAISLFEDVKRIKGKFRDPEQYEGKIYIATTNAIIDNILPPFVDSFKKLHPCVAFHFEGTIHEMICEKVESGEADIGIAICDNTPQTISCYDMFEDGLILIAPKHNLFFPWKSPTLRQIAQAPMILFTRWGNLQTLIEQRFADERLRPNVVMTQNNFASIKKYVAMGMGTAILGSHAVSPEDERIFDIFSLDHYLPKRRYRILLKKKYFSPMVRSFLRTIKPDIEFAFQNRTVKT